MQLPPLEMPFKFDPENSTRTQICLSIMLERDWNVEDILARAANADALELRLDKVPQADVAELCRRFAGETIATIRRARDGGVWRGHAGDRLKQLKRLAATVTYVDVEFDLFDKFMALMQNQPQDFGVICSWHVQTEELATLYENLAVFTECIPNVHKLVLPAGMPLHHYLDIQSYFFRIPTVNLAVVHGLGANAGCTRILGSTQFNLWTYVAEDAANATASGQVTLAEARDLYGLHLRDFDARRCGIIGYPLGQSKSLELHNRLASTMGLNLCYVACEVESELEAMDLLPELSCWSVTLPHKELAAKMAQEMSVEAQRSGVCNTLIYRPDGTTYGTNTDVLAMMNLLMEHVDSVSNALVYGSGATARSAIATLRLLGINDISLAARNPAACDELIEKFELQAAELGTPYDLVIQSSAAGMWPKSDELSPAAQYLPGAKFALDVVYNPAQTRFLERAAELGVETRISGERMFLLQARHQFELFTGHLPEMQLLEKIWGEIHT